MLIGRVLRALPSQARCGAQLSRGSVRRGSGLRAYGHAVAARTGAWRSGRKSISARQCRILIELGKWRRNLDRRRAGQFDGSGVDRLLETH